MSINLRDPQIEKAVALIERRAERQADDLTLYNTYVDSGVLSEMSKTESQIVFGRRGVGKSHLLHFHRQSVLQEDPFNFYLILNCQDLGSGLQLVSKDPKVVARNFFLEFLNELATHLFDNTDRLELATSQKAALEKVAVTFVDVINTADEGFDFRNAGDVLEGYREKANLNKLYIALDEFVAIPEDVQPFFAEHIKRLFVSNKNVVLKIASVTYQTRLMEVVDGRQIGLEAGADIFNDINLDMYFIWDENRAAVESFFLQVLYNHIAEALGWDLSVPKEQKAEKIISTFFTQDKCAQELIRAAEGNCRDLFNLFKLSYSEFKRESASAASRIGLEHLKGAARHWYRTGKLNNLSPNTRDYEFLNYLIQQIIKGKRARTFMVHYIDWRHPLLLKLLNLRLLHLLRTTWSHPDKPGEPYYLFTIDYGCYLDLKGTRAEPTLDLFFDNSQSGQDDFVPLDDRRSIRRIVLTREDLQKFS